MASNERTVTDAISHGEISAKRNALGRCIAFLECPHCQAHSSSDCKSFQFEDLDAKHQCIACGKIKPVKEWRCECNVIWHTCSKHKFAKAHDYKTPKQSKATNGQSSPASHHNTKRTKIHGESSLSILMSADVNGVRASKRKRNAIPNNLKFIGFMVMRNLLKV